MSENKKTINWNALTAVIFATAEENHVDTGVAANMVRDNIIDGKETWPLRGSMPMKFVDMIPDWPSMGGREAALASQEGYDAWLRTIDQHIEELGQYWRERKCQHMVTLMEQAADPGPIDGIKPGEDVPTPLGDNE